MRDPTGKVGSSESSKRYVTVPTLPVAAALFTSSAGRRLCVWKPPTGDFAVGVASAALGAGAAGEPASLPLQDAAPRTARSDCGEPAPSARARRDKSTVHESIHRISECRWPRTAANPEVPIDGSRPRTRLLALAAGSRRGRRNAAPVHRCHRPEDRGYRSSDHPDRPGSPAGLRCPRWPSRNTCAPGLSDHHRRCPLVEVRART